MSFFDSFITILRISRNKEDEWRFPNLTAKWTGEAS